MPTLSILDWAFWCWGLDGLTDMFLLFGFDGYVGWGGEVEYETWYFHTEFHNIAVISYQYPNKNISNRET